MEGNVAQNKKTKEEIQNLKRDRTDVIECATCAVAKGLSIDIIDILYDFLLKLFFFIKFHEITRFLGYSFKIYPQFSVLSLTKLVYRTNLQPLTYEESLTVF